MAITKNSVWITAVALAACVPIFASLGAEGQENKSTITTASIANAAEEKIRPFTIGPEAFDPDDGHIQGIAASDHALYLSQKTQIVKVDWTGNVLKKLKVESHTGDVAYHDGKLFTAIALFPDRKEGRIQVFDQELNLLQEMSVDRTLDGIACLDGVLYVGMGAKEQPSSNPHRVNILGRFDAETLKEITPRLEFDYGHETKFGFQNITTDGTLLYASFYAIGNAPQIVSFDKDMNICRMYRFPANQGLDVMPKSLTGGKVKFVRSRNKITRNPNLVTCFVEFPKLNESLVMPKPAAPTSRARHHRNRDRPSLRGSVAPVVRKTPPVLLELPQ